MKRFLIHCDTCWCGMDNTFRVLAEKESDVEDYTQEELIDNIV